MNRVSQALAVLLASAVAAVAAPPVVTVPAEVPGTLANFVLVKATVTEAKVVKFVALDPGLNVFPSGLLTDQTVTVVTANKPGRYRLLAYSGNADGPSEPALTTVVITDVPSPNNPPVKPEPPKDPPANPAEVYYFAVVRPDGAASKEMEAVMALPAWDELRKAGHAVSTFTVGELPGLKLEVPKTVPAVIVLKRDVGGKTWTDTKSNQPLPTTNESIRGLLK